ncbi:aldehyde dehydrogenase family protein [Ectobacillus ponti]|uniref:Aldehyde dehydrogenase family protein n=1 Tax=Ectobacillus ponti TaxID=2961894 RepID=A0AA42BQL0_9BACI|nr:aldehyde dehydrogenase family protein [Ectobacillus ponti]MCP8970405.1 aldehyde dehydrogenase family protein [Ectobacillus ponti]
MDFDLQSLQEMRDAVRQAKAAQETFQTFSQQRVDEVVRAISEAALQAAQELAVLAVEETGMGVVAHKALKNEVAARDVYESIRHERTVGLLREDKHAKVMEYGSPFGVIAAMVPTTNPTSTAIFKSMIALKAQNSIVISPHPNAARCTVRAAEICAEAAVAAGAPEGLISWISKPTMIAAEGLMKHPDVHLVVATGGSALVRAAYSSGKPAYGVGPGNVPVYIDRTAQPGPAVERIVMSKTFDHGTICASEQAVIVDRYIQEQVIHAFKQQCAYFVNAEEKQRLARVISPAPGKLNPAIVGKSARDIAALAQIAVPAGTRLLLAEESMVGKEYPFSLEKLSPILAFYTVNGWEEALELSKMLLHHGGNGHTLALHTSDERVAREFAQQCPVSRIVVNTPSALGAVGATTGLKPSFTLGCGTFGGNMTSDNLSSHHLLNIKRLAYGMKELSIGAEEQQAALPEVKVEEIVQQVLKQAAGLERLDHEHVSRLVAQALAAVQSN